MCTRFCREPSRRIFPWSSPRRRGDRMRRREFIVLVGGAAVGWPLTARAQQPVRVRRIGLLMGYPEGDLQAQANVSALREGLRTLGWIEGHNIRIDYRWAGADADKARTFAKELVHPSGIEGLISAQAVRGFASMVQRKGLAMVALK